MAKLTPSEYRLSSEAAVVPAEDTPGAPLRLRLAPGPAMPAGIDVTCQLAARAIGLRDRGAEAEALIAMMRCVADEPARLPQRAAELLRPLCDAGSCGVALVECEVGEEAIFDLAGVAGSLSRLAGARWSIARSIAGRLGEAAMLLAPPRPLVAQVDPGIDVAELLACAVPGEDGRIAGVVWAATHDGMRRFDSEDARLLERFARFLGPALATWRCAERQALQHEELRHRLRNDLQIASSLIQIGRKRISDPDAVALVDEVLRRLELLAMTRRDLPERGPVDVIPVFRELCEALAAGIDHISIELAVEGDIGTVPAPTALPLVLVLNELVTNALKHGYPDGRAGVIKVTMANCGERQLVLTVGNDGVPFGCGQKAQGTAQVEDAHHGLDLVQALVRQMRGSCELPSPQAGQQIIVTIPR